MTSTDNQVGLTDSSNISTKVLAPPGGKTSISLFGNDSDPTPAPTQREVNQCQVARNKSNVFASDTPVPEAAPAHHKQSQQRRQQSSVFGEPPQPVPKPSFEPEPRKPHLVNPHQEARQKSTVFEEPKVQAKPPPRKTSDIISGQGVNSEEKAHTTVKMHAPPGGKSSISFG
ncbi:PREDICTED: uncharacterized protein LOC107340225 [Acropora digitifera]|uniref:uncharacterized protein LOC107340225 n=1 Tax=Acropora digitifera TaxID=70779 RepID=UPI00077A128A|nr:PREDICTED: uncharacterized protein LOC107340225 [Acropora digitifera]